MVFLRFDLAVALLLSVIVSSTDAPAVLVIMRTQKTRLRGSLRPLLEFESGSNDPMAVLLSLGALAFCKNSALTPPLCSKCSVLQLALGWRSVLFWGKLALVLLQKVCICYFGLYTVFGVGFGAAAFWVGPVCWTATVFGGLRQRHRGRELSFHLSTQSDPLSRFSQLDNAGRDVSVVGTAGQSP